MVDVELAHAPAAPTGPAAGGRGHDPDGACRPPDDWPRSRRHGGNRDDGRRRLRRWWPARLRRAAAVRRRRHAGGRATTSSTAGTRRVGLPHRSTLDTTPDRDGAAFAFVVNGRRTWVRGFNWIPDDCFPARVTPARSPSASTRRPAANANLLRVWGGGVYESDDFYDDCDRARRAGLAGLPLRLRGVPRGGAAAAEVRAEATDNVARLAAHPSLLVWCGNNENLWGSPTGGGRSSSPGDRGATGYYRDAAARASWPSSTRRGPTSPAARPRSTPALHPNDARPRHGAHLGRLERRDYTALPRPTPRGSSPSSATRRRRPPDAAPRPRRPPARPDSTRCSLHHQKAADGNAKLDRVACAPHFGLAADADDWHYLTQLNQADAVTRRRGALPLLHDRCSGAIVWQLNDCWPVTSLGRRRRRRTPQAAVVRPPARLRRPHADRRAGRRRGAADARERRGDGVGRPPARRRARRRRFASSESTSRRCTSIRTAAIRVDVPAACVPGAMTDVDVVVATIGDHRAVHEAPAPRRHRTGMSMSSPRPTASTSSSPRGPRPRPVLLRRTARSRRRSGRPTRDPSGRRVAPLRGAHAGRRRRRVAGRCARERSLVLRARGDRPTGQGRPDPPPIIEPGERRPRSSTARHD